MSEPGQGGNGGPTDANVNPSEARSSIPAQGSSPVRTGEIFLTPADTAEGSDFLAPDRFEEWSRDTSVEAFFPIDRMDRGPLSSFVAWSRSHPSLKDDRPAITPIRLKVPLDDLTPGAIAETLTAISQVVDLAYRLYAAANPGAVLEPPVIYEIGIGSVSVSIGVAEGVARLVKSMLSTRDGIVQRGDRDRASSASADTAEATAQVAGVEAGAATQKADDDHELRLAQAEEIRANAHKTEAEAEAIRLANITRRLEVATAIASLGLDALQLAAIVCTQDEKALQYLIERGTTVEDE